MVSVLMSHTDTAASGTPHSNVRDLWLFWHLVVLTLQTGILANLIFHAFVPTTLHNALAP